MISISKFAHLEITIQVVSSSAAGGKLDTCSWSSHSFKVCLCKNHLIYLSTLLGIHMANAWQARQ